MNERARRTFPGETSASRGVAARTSDSATAWSPTLEEPHVTVRPRRPGDLAGVRHPRRSVRADPGPVRELLMRHHIRVHVTRTGSRDVATRDLDRRAKARGSRRRAKRCSAATSNAPSRSPSSAWSWRSWRSGTTSSTSTSSSGSWCRTRPWSPCSAGRTGRTARGCGRHAARDRRVRVDARPVPPGPLRRTRLHAVHRRLRRPGRPRGRAAGALPSRTGTRTAGSCRAPHRDLQVAASAARTARSTRIGT